MAPPRQDEQAAGSVPAYLPLTPLLRVGRWVILLALAAVLFYGHPQLRSPGLRSGIAVLLGLYALVSTLVLRARALSPARILGIILADLAFIALLVERTGGMRSPFFGLYYLVVVASALFYNLLGGLLAAAAVVGITALGEWSRFHGAEPLPTATLMATLPYLLLAAIVAGQLTGQLKREVRRHREAEQAALRLQIEREAIEREMALAREVQQAALPQVPAAAAGLEVGVRFRAAAEVGGDFYDFFQEGDELGLLVGDAGGKGVPAALVATTAMHLFHTQAPHMGLEDWCREFNRELEERAPAAMLATAFCCRLDTGTGQGVWVNAGHPPPVLCRAGQPPFLLENHGLLFGAVAEATYSTQELVLSPGDFLVIYSDGLIEAVRADGSRLGIEPLLESLSAMATAEATAIAGQIEADLLQIASLRDDLTIVVIKKR